MYDNVVASRELSAAATERAGLYLLVGEPFHPGHRGSAWAIMVIWAAAHIGAFLAELVRPAPPMVHMLMRALRSVT